MLNRSPEDSMQDIDKRSMIWGMFMGKNYSDNKHPSKNTRKISLQRRCFRYLNSLILEQSDEIFGVSQISWESSPWKQFSLVNDEEVISLSHAKVYVFSDSVLCLGKMNQNPIPDTVWEQQLGWFQNFITIQSFGHKWCEVDWNIFLGFSTLELVREVQQFMSNIGEPEQFQGRIIFMSMFNDIIWWNKDNENEMYC